MDPYRCGGERADRPAAQFVHPFRHVEGSPAPDTGTVRGPGPVGFVTLTVLVWGAIIWAPSRVARCARGFAETDPMSSSSRPVGGRSTGRAE